MIIIGIMAMNNLWVPIIFGILIFSGFGVTQQAFAQSLTCNISLDPGQEVPAPNVAGFSPTGSAVVVVNTGTGDVSITGTYSGMTSDVNNSHLHGLAPPGVATGVIFGLANTGGTAGSFNGISTLSAANLAGFLAGQTYINVHTVNNGPGEIRGQVICPSAVGGEFIGIDSTMVLVSGAQYTVAWMIPVIVSAIGIGIVIARKF